MVKGDVVRVLWVDSLASGGWAKPDAASPLTHETVAKLYAELDDRYILTSTIDHADHALSPLHIPRKSVVSIRVIPE